MKWISVKERLPESHRYVLAIDDREPGLRGVELTQYIEEAGKWHVPRWFDKKYEPTHWMPIDRPVAKDHRAESKREGREL